MAKKMTLCDCPPGLFRFGRTLCFKSEYGDNSGPIDAYVVSSGEFFWGGAKTGSEQAELLVTPVSHRANRLTRAERAVVKAAKNWHRKECLETRVRLMHAIDKLARAKGGAR
jgi:hypothetical protein